MKLHNYLTKINLAFSYQNCTLTSFFCNCKILFPQELLNYIFIQLQINFFAKNYEISFFIKTVNVIFRKKRIIKYLKF